MLTMILKRMAMAIPSLIGVVIVTFVLTRALPGDPAAYFAGPAATPAAIQEVRVKLGLDKPLPEQCGRYVVDLAHGDDLLELLAHLLDDPVVAHDDDRDPRQVRVLGLADGEAVDVEPARGKHPRDVRQDPRLVLDQGR